MHMRNCNIQFDSGASVVFVALGVSWNLHLRKRFQHTAAEKVFFRSVVEASALIMCRFSQHHTAHSTTKFVSVVTAGTHIGASTDSGAAGGDHPARRCVHQDGGFSHPRAAIGLRRPD